ncbi:unnamed protein product, partial [marine sediment metagenome]
MIPISLKVTINTSRLLYVLQVPDGIVVRTSSIQEELG